MYSSDELFQHSREGYFGVYTKHQNNTRVSAKTVRQKSTYIALFFTWHKESINDDKKRRSLHIVPVSHSLKFRSADDVTVDC